jgi:hypothetical protein
MATNDDDTTDDKTTTGSDDAGAPKRPKGGRNLADPRSRSNRASVAAEEDPDDDVGPHRGEFEPEPEVAPSIHEGPMGRQLAQAVAPKVLVWNTTAGLRMGVANAVAKDEKGDVRLDGAGHVIYAEQINHMLKPGLNLVPVDTFRKIRPGLQKRVDLGEIQCLGDDPCAVAVPRLQRAIAETGLDNVLLWIAERDNRTPILQAIERQKLTFKMDERRAS